MNSIPKRPIILLFILLALTFPLLSSKTKVIQVKDFNVAGDGKTDDGPAIRNALEAAVKAGPGTRLVFEPGTYRLGSYAQHFHLQLENLHDLTIEGNGSRMILHPGSGFLLIDNCKNIIFRGFTVKYNPLPFTQGTIQMVVVMPDKGFFDLKIQKGFPLPPEDALVKKYFRAQGWRWGSVIDPKERHRRWDVNDHFEIDTVMKIKQGLYRFKVEDKYAKDLLPVCSGDRFFMPLRLMADKVITAGHNIIIRGSSDCTVEDITIHSARSGMIFSISRNEGRIILRRNKIMFEPGTANLCTAWKDGIHCKDNRIGPIIEDFFFEGMLDDSINIGANTAMAVEVFSSTEFLLKGPAFSPGDKVMVFDPVSGEIMAKTRVVKLKKNGKGINRRKTHLVLADPIEGVITGSKQKYIDKKSTHFYNMSYSCNDFVIRNCIFKPQRRHAMLIRGSNGVIENNTIDSVGGGAVFMGNEMGSFYEGPFPTNNIIRNNTIRNTQRNAIYIFTKQLKGSFKHTKNIIVEDNSITVLPGKLGIVIKKAGNVTLKGNRILDQQGKNINNIGILIKN